MSDIVLRVENLWKQYRLGVTGATTLRDDLARFWARMRGKEDPTALVGSTNALNEVSSDYVWALQDINFEVKRGEVLGIIGKNGAGKSTLLKILSKVTGPTRGHIQIKGRVASLLEVGTGFHPELTGRENIFLNGAILGMTKAEIRKKLDEIIDFAGVAKYVDTPVKRYSSGMRVRLGFAVAAFLEPEILVVDEVLAVGDAEFQKKAIGKMQDVSQGEGRTVLFVSHNMSSLKTLCTQGILLEMGTITNTGEVNEVVNAYLSKSHTEADQAIVTYPEDPEKDFQVSFGRMINDRGEITQYFEANEIISIEFGTIVNKTVPGLYGYLTLSNKEGVLVLEGDSYDSGQNPMDGLPPGKHLFRVKIPQRLLAPGTYQVYMNFASFQNTNGFNVDSPRYMLTFTVTDNNSRRGNNRKGLHGILLNWEKIHA